MYCTQVLLQTINVPNHCIPLKIGLTLFCGCSTPVVCKKVYCVETFYSKNLCMVEKVCCKNIASSGGCFRWITGKPVLDCFYLSPWFKNYQRLQLILSLAFPQATLSDKKGEEILFFISRRNQKVRRCAKKSWFTASPYVPPGCCIKCTVTYDFTF